MKKVNLDKEMEGRKKYEYQYCRKEGKKCINCGKSITNKAIKCKSCFQKNEKNPNWKGDEVGYNALHAWVRRNKPKSEFCEECKIKKPYDLANISGNYKRDINDFEWLCRSCHIKGDGRLDNINKIRKNYLEKGIIIHPSKRKEVKEKISLACTNRKRDKIGRFKK